jgi:hypothetical protein
MPFFARRGKRGHARREVEDEALRRDARLLSGRPDRGERLLHGAAEELGNAASIPERLALEEAEEVLIVAGTTVGTEMLSRSRQSAQL